MTHTFHFTHELERDGAPIEVEVEYGIDYDEICLVSVQLDGKEIDTTDAEDRKLTQYAEDRAHEDLAAEADDYADYLRDLRLDCED